MTVLQLAKLRASLCPGEVRWDWPKPNSGRIYNQRFRGVERPVVVR